MKKQIYALALILALIMLASCSPQTAQPGQPEQPEQPSQAEPATEEAVYLDIPGESYALDSESIPYAIVNNSGQAVQVQLIPHLARETATGWAEIPTVDVGFCGTPDSVETRWEASLLLSWYGDTLTPGHYRLSYQTVSGLEYKPGEMLSAEFDLTEATAAAEPFWIYADDTADATGLNLYWQSDNLNFAADDSATLSIYVNAAQNEDGNFAFDDGQDWLMLLETSGGNYALFPREYVQLGAVSCVVFLDNQDVFHVLVTVGQTADYRLYDCVFNQQQAAFQVIPVYHGAGINFMAASP